MREVSANLAAMHNHLTADMMHDALRGDVLTAIVKHSLVRHGVAYKEDSEILKDLEAHSAVFRDMLLGSERLELSAEVKVGLVQLRPTLDRYIQSASRLTNLALRNPVAAEKQLDVFFADFEQLEGEMSALGKTIGQNAARAEQQANNAVHQAHLVMLTATAISLLVLLMLSQRLAGRFTRALQHLLDSARKIDAGDLNTVILLASRDEIGDLARVMNGMRDKLNGIVQEVKQGAVRIASGATEIAGGVNVLSQRTEEQASILEETAASMEEMTSTVRQGADSTRQTDTLARAALQEAEQGGAIVKQTVAAMSAISASSNKIADIIGVIDEIAFQTNLLALNAAVEAARAGEQGRGFAVVAAEVRNLAQRSAVAAKEIKGLIEDGVSKIKTGEELVRRSGDTLHKIIVSVNKVSDIAAEISAASQEQSAGIEQINKAVMQMDEMTQHNAALVEEVSAASTSMEEQAHRLLEQFDFFRAADAAEPPASTRGQARTEQPPAAMRRRAA
jgi:methyl-accepting chemotaxis protein